MIPVTVLTGFLGSGKTTLLARLLAEPALSRTAVIINELGAVGIDHDLVAASEERFVTLATGCLCCAVRGDLEATIADLVARRAEGLVPAFERIVIETSGLADPAPILNAILAETDRGTGIRLADVVTTVDAMTGLDVLASEPQSARQVAVADRLIVTKTDLAGGMPEALAERIAALNSRATVLTAVRGDVAANAVIGDNAAEADNGGKAEAWLGAERIPSTPFVHDATVGSIVVRREQPLPALALTLLLEALADHLGDRLLRMKGIVYVAERPDRPGVIHGVGHLFHEPEWLARWPSDDRSTRLVLIGRGLSALWVERLIGAIDAEIAEVAAGPE